MRKIIAVTLIAALFGSEALAQARGSPFLPQSLAKCAHVDRILNVE